MENVLLRLLWRFRRQPRGPLFAHVWSWTPEIAIGQEDGNSGTLTLYKEQEICLCRLISASLGTDVDVDVTLALFQAGGDRWRSANIPVHTHHQKDVLDSSSSHSFFFFFPFPFFPFPFFFYQTDPNASDPFTTYIRLSRFSTWNHQPSRSTKVARDETALKANTVRDANIQAKSINFVGPNGEFKAKDPSPTSSAITIPPSTHYSISHPWQMFRRANSSPMPNSKPRTLN
ncbi:hypothetical protein G7K_4135-t1 [Saitoella complicata NRRL Y-17804]|uniref:Uncharacterized protein n=1 Tax=Saitoella complicata (strain BCRC 22490 / CBS 7301 / JCM 7358 / NBRC 10748 / NRRL Y-17804) TaxID=698492 RepID=A0A0E9NKR5_SAICN|nr:hypothetical protein G7K_4135-t1 [Saitoella complicata NRRL Y-17804]